MGGRELSGLIASIRSFLRKVGADYGILFGSRARGDDISTSDVDLIVVSPAFERMKFPYRLIYLHENWELPQFLEGLPYTPDEIEHLKDRSLIREALDKGIRIQA